MTEPVAGAGPEFWYHAQLRWSDADVMGHLNHARYLTLFEDARMTWLARSPSGLAGAPGDRGYIAGRVAVDFLAPVRYRAGATVRIRSTVTRVGTKSWTLAQHLYDGDQLVAHCECVLVGYSYAAAAARVLDDDERAFWTDPR